MNCVIAESINDIMLKIKSLCNAVVSQALGDNLVRVSSESSQLINKYDCSFTIPKIKKSFKDI